MLSMNQRDSTEYGRSRDCSARVLPVAQPEAAVAVARPVSGCRVILCRVEVGRGDGGSSDTLLDRVRKSECGHSVTPHLVIKMDANFERYGERASGGLGSLWGSRGIKDDTWNTCASKEVRGKDTN